MPNRGPIVFAPRRREDAVLLFATLITVAPLWSAHHLPFSDLPEHVATMATLHHWFDPSWHAADTYELAFGRSQYVAYHVAGAALMFVTRDASLANLLLMTAAGIALPFGMRALLRAVGGDGRLALLSPTLFWSRPLMVGLLPYVAAISLSIWLLALAVRQLEAPRHWRSVTLALLGLVDFYLHLGAYTLLVAATALFALALPQGTWSLRELPHRLRNLPRNLAWLAPSLLAACVWMARSDRDAGPAALGTDTVFLPYGVLPQLFAGWTHDIWRDHLDEVTGISFWGLVVWLSLVPQEPEPGGVRRVAVRWLPFVATLILFCALPFRVGPAAMINIRLAVFLPLFVLLVPRPSRARASWPPLAVATALSLAVAVHATWSIRACERELGAFDAILSDIRPGSRLLTLQFEHDSVVSHFPPWIHIGALHRARMGGVASVSFTELPHWPVRYRPEAAPPTRPRWFWEFRPCSYRNTVDGPYYDYVLVRGAVDPFASEPPGPRFVRVRAVTGWTLFERSAGEPNTSTSTSARDAFDSRPDHGPCGVEGER